MTKLEGGLKFAYYEVKPVLHTFVFELKKQWKKFIGFFIISVLIVVLQSFILYAFFSDNLLPTSHFSYLSNGLTFLTSFIIMIASCLFFSGIICSEYSDKTGYIVFPKINKYKLIIGKYLGNLFLETCVIAIYYFLVGYLSFFFYDQFSGTLLIRYFISFGFALLYMIAMSSFVTFFSSFLRSVNITIIVTFMILFMGFQLADMFLMMLAPEIEPLYSLNHMAKLITSILLVEFPDPNFSEMSFGGNFTFKTWLTPTIGMGLLILSLYIIIGFFLAAYLFKRRQL